MSRFRKLSQTIWHCQYYIIWTPKYRYRILTGDIAQDIDNCVHGFSERLGCEITWSDFLQMDSRYKSLPTRDTLHILKRDNGKISRECKESAVLPR